MIKVKWISRWLLLSPYCIGVCKSEDQFNRELKRLKIPPNQWPDWIGIGNDGKTHFFEKDDKRDSACIVCIRARKGLRKSEMIGLIIHEAVHVWQAIRDEIGEKDPSQEFEAYSIQTITQRLIEEYYHAL